MLAGLVPYDSYEGECVPCLSPSIWWFAGVFGVPWLLLYQPDLCLHLHMVFSLRACWCPNFPFLIRRPVMLD